MASSNRHWPSMFRSNPAARDLQQQQPDMNSHSSSLLSSPGSGKPSLISSGIEEISTRSPEAKPRWNPRPEQIRILEGIFNSGTVNPPRDEIRRIRLQLQEYGQVGDANVFYWFQNRKSRTKNKLRAAAGRDGAALARACASPPQAAAPAPAPVTPPRHFLASPLGPTSSSSSSSDRSFGSSKSVMKPAALASAAAASNQEMLPPSTAINLFSPTTAPALSACQLYYRNHPMPTPTAPVRELASLEPALLFPQWPQRQYLPATELGGVLGSSHEHTTPTPMHPAVSPGVLLGLCNDALGQQDIIDMSCSKELGQYFNNNTCTTDQPSHKTDEVMSAVIREDEKARLGLMHYVLGVATAAVADADAAPVQAAVAAADVGTAVLPFAAPSNAATSSAALTDQLQVFDLPGLLDAGLIGGAPPTATVVVAVAARPDAVQYYSVPATMRLDVKLFGEAAVLLRHTGEPVLVDESGVTVEPLQQGAVYYVLVTD